MKILIMGFGKIKFMPYLNFYLENIDKEKHEVHLLYWNRDLKHEDTSHLDGITLHEFRCLQEDDVPKGEKLGSFAEYRRFALGVLKDEGFDFVIIMHSLTGIVVEDYIVRHFRDRFVFDFRDVTFENILPFKVAVGSLVRNSALTFVSSDIFRIYLPQEKNKILTIHNTSVREADFTGSQKQKGKIRIGFWGFIRDKKLNERVISCLGDDSRFELHFYGREQDVALGLKAFVQESGFQNIFFHGEYAPEEKKSIIENTDLIHNIYDDKGAMLAVGNKYYDGVYYGKPQLCMEGSFMSVLCMGRGTGFSCNPYKEGFADKIYELYNQLDYEQLKRNCAGVAAEVSAQQERNAAVLTEVLAKKEVVG